MKYIVNMELLGKSRDYLLLNCCVCKEICRFEKLEHFRSWGEGGVTTDYGRVVYTAACTLSSVLVT